MRRVFRLVIGLLCGLLCATAIVPAAAHADRRFELGVDGSALSDGQSDWIGSRGRLELSLGASDILFGEFNLARRFDESGALFGASLQHDYSDSTYQLISLSGSTAGLFWPRLGGNTQIFHKLGERKSLILGAGLGYFNYRTETSDMQGLLEAIYYFQVPWVIEGGVRANVAQPGSVTSARAFVALTWLAAEGTQLIAKFDAGDEAYQLVSDQSVQTRFSSHSVALETITPLSPLLGASLGGARSVHLSVERYSNPFYTRWSGYLGISQGF